MTHNILYVMGLTRANDGTQLPDRKIGITGSQKATLESRVLSLSGTKSPFIVEPLAAWRIDDARAAESVLHALLQPIQSQGEWFIDNDNYLIDAITVFMAREPTAESIPIDTRNDPALDRAKKLRETEYDQRTDEIFGLLSETFPAEYLRKPRSDGFIGLETDDAKLWTRVLQRGFSILIHPKSPELALDYDRYHSILESMGLQYHHRSSNNGEFIQSRCDDKGTLIDAIKKLCQLE